MFRQKHELGGTMSLFWQTHWLGCIILSWQKQELGGDLADSGRRMAREYDLDLAEAIAYDESWQKCTAGYGL